MQPLELYTILKDINYHEYKQKYFQWKQNHMKTLSDLKKRISYNYAYISCGKCSREIGSLNDIIQIENMRMEVKVETNKIQEPKHQINLGEVHN